MNINENEFFYQMTLSICGSLNSETALRRSIQYFAQVMPVDAIHLHLYEKKMGSVRTIAEATAQAMKRLDKITPLNQEGRASFEKPGVQNVRIVNRQEEDPVMKKIFESLKIANASALVMRLKIEGKMIGSLSIMARGRDKYTQENARLLSLLNEPIAIALSNALEHQEVLRFKDMLKDDNRYLHQELLRISGDEIIGSDFGLRDVMEMVQKVAPLESPVLLLGETGVGKGIIANAIHNLSPRRKNSFITVNSGAIPENLIDSELFGHEKGSFTGAIDQKRGRFERANQGTIFLDEIGELPPPAQIRMLQVLQDKKIERIGGTKSIPVDIRIIAATHRNLPEMIKANQFREDLWFRINVFPIRVPPLRERKEDIPSLVHYFMKKITRDLKIPLLPELERSAIDRLMNYQWPGNVRELANLVERELILSKGKPLVFSVLDGSESTGKFSAPGKPDTSSLTLDQINAQYIRNVLKSVHGVVHGPGGAAAILGINPSTLRSRMKKMGIPFGRNK